MGSSSASGKICTPNTGAFKNVLRKDNIRVFGYRDKYILVDSNESVFIMFENVPIEQQIESSPGTPTIKMVNFPISCKLSSLPIAHKIPFSNLSAVDLKYMCDTYENSPMGYLNSKSYKERVSRIASRYNVSYKFAKVLALLPRSTNLGELCHDIREANFYLSNKPDWKYTLKEGTLEQQKAILHKLLSPEAYEIFQLSKMPFPTVSIIIHEIFNIK